MRNLILQPARPTLRFSSDVSMQVGPEALPEAAVETLLAGSANWNFVLIGVALAVGGLFEFGVEAIKKSLPTRLLPAIEQSVTELATLGFVGLFIQVVNSGSGAEALSDVSLRFVGEADFLVERFESLHEALFTVTLLYLASCTLLIVRVSLQFREWGAARRDDYLAFKIAEYEFQQANGPEAKFAERGWSQAAAKMEMAPPPPAEYGALGRGWAELRATKADRTAEFLRFRERFIEQTCREIFFVPRSFAFDEYLEQHASQSLKELVSVEPASVAAAWAPVALASLLAELLGLSATGIPLGQLPPPEQTYVSELSSLELVFLGAQKLVLFNAIVSIAVAGGFVREGAPLALACVALAPAAIAIALSPATFLAYNIATAVEALKDPEALRQVLRRQRERAFLAKLSTLLRMCDVFDSACSGDGLSVGPVGERRSLGAMLDDGTPSAIYNLQTIFDFADLDGGGTLCREEVAALGSTLGYELSDAALDNIFERMACGPTGCALDIQFGDFVSGVAALETRARGSEGARAARGGRLFDFFDVAGRGHIAVDDMTRRLERLGFDTAGTEQLFVDITGFPKRTISTLEFARYLAGKGLVE